MAGIKHRKYQLVSLDKAWEGILDGTHEIRPGIYVYELACSDGCEIILTTSELLNKMSAARSLAIERYGATGVHLESVYRTPKYNWSLPNSSDTSTHMHGSAWDSWPLPAGVCTGLQWAEILVEVGFKYTYQIGNGSVHADLRMRGGSYA